MGTVVLYCQVKSVYKRLGLDLDIYDINRNAKTYRGSKPVIAHPPCAPWGNYAWNSKQSKSTAIHAFKVVTNNGGLLEHPSHSKLWDMFSVPKPGEPAIRINGRWLWSVSVCQGAYGHISHKPTWIMVCSKETFNTEVNELDFSKAYGKINSMRKEARKSTPKRFALFLIDIMNQVS